MRTVAASLLLSCLALGCEGEAIDLTPPLRDGGPGGAGGAAGGGGGMPGGSGGTGGQGSGPGGAGGAGGSVTPAPVDWPSEAALARFAEEVLPLYDSCGACHGSGSQRDGDGDTIWPAAPESPSSADVEAYFHEFEDAVVWGEPEQSVFLAASRGQVVSIQHPEAWAQDTPADRQVAAFIRETTIPEGPPPGADMGPGPTPDQGPPEEDDMGAGPAPGVPCEGLPVGDPLGRAALFEQFEADINPLLVDSCAEGICHGTPGNGGAYWLAVSSPCSVQWNYTVSLTFIDYQDADRSPLTALPVSSDHGGRQVFNGREDPRFTRLLAWVRAAAGSP